MKRIKTFGDFLNEAGWGSDFLSIWGDFKQAAQSALKDTTEKVDKVDKPAPTTTTAPTATPTPTQVASADLSTIKAVPGNDDFVLYMQHQQGGGGAKSLISAAAGLGNIHPDTMKTKNCSHLGGRVPYANLQCNIPSDRPQYRKDIVAALDRGDQKTGATLFLKMWKEKWQAKYKQAQTLINQPKYAAVKQAIEQNCKTYGVPFDFAATVALIESGFNPNDGNASYKGLFALSREEFNKYVPGGNILSLQDNAKAGVQCLKNNIKEFTKYLGPLIAKVDVGNWARSLA